MSWRLDLLDAAPHATRPATIWLGHSSKTTTIGRDPSNIGAVLSTPMFDNYISKVHARLVVDETGGVVTLEDMSMNGCSIDDTAIGKHEP
eukprot:997843-Prymnesium_polylepis.2